MKKILLTFASLLCFAMPSFARQQAYYTVENSTNGIYQVYKGTFVFTDSLDAFPSSATYNQKVVIDGKNGTITGTHYGDGSHLTGVLLYGVDTDCRVSTGVIQNQLNNEISSRAALGLIVAESTTTLAATHVSKSGDTMTGDLAVPNLSSTHGVSASTGIFSTSVTAPNISATYGINAATATITGSSFSVGGSTLIVTNGRVGIGKTPTYALDVNGAISASMLSYFTSGAQINAKVYPLALLPSLTGFRVTNYDKAIQMELDSGSPIFYLTDYRNRVVTHTLPSHNAPTFVIFSGTSPAVSSSKQYGEFYHDSYNFNINSGTGTIKLNGVDVSGYLSLSTATWQAYDSAGLEGHNSEYFLSSDSATTTYVPRATYSEAPDTWVQNAWHSTSSDDASQFDHHDPDYFLSASSAAETYQYKLIDGETYHIVVDSANYALNGGNSFDPTKPMYLSGSRISINNPEYMGAYSSTLYFCVGDSTCSIIRGGNHSGSTYWGPSGGGGLSQDYGCLYYGGGWSFGDEEGIGFYCQAGTIKTDYGVKTSTLQVTSGAGEGKIAVSDAVGNLTWSDSSWGATAFNAIIPVGFEYQCGVSTVPPAGYNLLFEDGQSVSTTTYSALFEYIAAGHSGNGYYFGGSGANFNIPDCRGYAPRGIDMGAGRDTETYRLIGSTETDTMQGHYHNFYYHTGPADSGTGRNNIAGNADDSSGPAIYNVRSAISDGTNGTPRTGAETRMKNRAVAYFIKY